MKKIAILGGTFDPPHNEHIKMAENAVKELNLDKLFVVPDYIPPHKTDKIITESRERLNMCKLAFAGKDKIDVSSYETDKKDKSYTYITIGHFAELYGDAEIYFILGTDMLDNFRFWSYPEKILEKCEIALIRRDGEIIKNRDAVKEFEEKFKRKVKILDYVGKDLSSTKIRIYKELNLEISSFVTESVKNYISEKNLYPKDKLFKYISEKLPENRRIHTAGVILTALRYNKILNLDEDKVITAALLHDCAKYENYENFKGFTLPDNNVPKPVIHQYLGAYIAKHVLNIDDEEILNAIMWHTTGKAAMTKMEKLIYLSDLIEPSRTFDGVDKIREAADENFESGFVFGLNEINKFLIKNNKPSDVYYRTREALDYYNKNEEKK